MELINYCDDRLTDKNTSHSYVEVYQKLFASKKESATHVLEIGIGSIPYWNGGSIKMWADYFTNAQIHAPDIVNIDIVYPDIISHPRIYLHTSNDAYNDRFFENTFLSKKGSPTILPTEVIRSTTVEKEFQISTLEAFKQRHQDKSADLLKKLQQVAIQNENLFEALMETVKYCSLGQITQALYQVGGQYRRNM